MQSTQKKERRIYRSFGLPESIMIFVENCAAQEHISVNAFVEKALDDYRTQSEVKPWEK